MSLLSYSEIHELTRDELLVIMREVPAQFRPAGNDLHEMRRCLWDAISRGANRKRLVELVRSARKAHKYMRKGPENDITRKGRRLPGSGFSNQ